MTTTNKVPSGKTAPDGEWNILTGSTSHWTHDQCGTEVVFVSILASGRVDDEMGTGETEFVTVPYCVHCELKPTAAVFYDDGRIEVTAWEGMHESVTT